MINGDLYDRSHPKGYTKQVQNPSARELGASTLSLQADITMITCMLSLAIAAIEGEEHDKSLQYFSVCFASS